MADYAKQPRIEWASAYSVMIHIAGSYNKAHVVCQQYCDAVGLCVTVTPTGYVFTGGHEAGVTVRLINYARFPKEPSEIDDLAYELARLLLEGLGQESFTIETPTLSKWYSWRAEDIARDP